ncbi:hypothetical protein ACVI1L_004764 [Bradyrhizobium sp. USDA 4516]
MSEVVRPLYDRAREFIRETVEPISDELEKLPENVADRWIFIPAYLELLEKAKAILHFLLGVRKRQEPVGVEAFGPEAAIEGLDERVVGWFAGPREVHRDAALVSPRIKIARHELAALIAPDSLRGSPLTAGRYAPSSAESRSSKALPINLSRSLYRHGKLRMVRV